MRGNTIRKLRTDKFAIKCVPGALQGLFKLPIEILYDVLELTHPLDLLHLSRSSKGLRAIVLNKNAERVWRGAYENYRYDLPYMPREVSPPKWTAMMYDDSRCDVSTHFDTIFSSSFVCLGLNADSLLCLVLWSIGSTARLRV